MSRSEKIYNRRLKESFRAHPETFQNNWREAWNYLKSQNYRGQAKIDVREVDLLGREWVIRNSYFSNRISWEEYVSSLKELEGEISGDESGEFRQSYRDLRNLFDGY